MLNIIQSTLGYNHSSRQSCNRCCCRSECLPGTCVGFADVLSSFLVYKQLVRWYWFNWIVDRGHWCVSYLDCHHIVRLIVWFSFVIGCTLLPVSQYWRSVFVDSSNRAGSVHCIPFRVTLPLIFPSISYVVVLVYPLVSSRRFCIQDSEHWDLFLLTLVVTCWSYL